MIIRYYDIFSELCVLERLLQDSNFKKEARVPNTSLTMNEDLSAASIRRSGNKLLKKKRGNLSKPSQTRHASRLIWDVIWKPYRKNSSLRMNFKLLKSVLNYLFIFQIYLQETMGYNTENWCSWSWLNCVRVRMYCSYFIVTKSLSVS